MSGRNIVSEQILTMEVGEVKECELGHISLEHFRVELTRVAKENDRHYKSQKSLKDGQLVVKRLK